MSGYDDEFEVDEANTRCFNCGADLGDDLTRCKECGYPDGGSALLVGRGEGGVFRNAWPPDWESDVVITEGPTGLV